MKNYTFYKVYYRDFSGRNENQVFRSNELHLIGKVCKEIAFQEKCEVKRIEVSAENLDMAFNKVM